jgi:hypothetical protein
VPDAVSCDYIGKIAIRKELFCDSICVATQRGAIDQLRVARKYRSLDTVINIVTAEYAHPLAVVLTTIMPLH